METPLENHNVSMKECLVKRTMKDIKSNKCNRCGYASYNTTNLRHLKMHSVEKSHKCDQCNFASSMVGNLRTHRETHSGEKSNKCNQCELVLDTFRISSAERVPSGCTQSRYIADISHKDICGASSDILPIYFTKIYIEPVPIYCCYISKRQKLGEARRSIKKAHRL